MRLVRRLNCIGGTFTLLHVGDASDFPMVHCPEVPGWEWKEETRTGGVIEAIALQRRKPNLTWWWCPPMGAMDSSTHYAAPIVSVCCAQCPHCVTVPGLRSPEQNQQARPQ